MLARHSLRSLETLLPRGQTFTDPATLITYEIDAGLDRGAPEGLVYPKSAGDVVRLVRWSTEQGVPVVARGAGTGLSGGAVAEHGGIIVEFSRMNSVLDLDEHGRTALLEPGVVNLAFDEQVRAKGLYFPPDPASQRASTIGGNVAENSGGPHCFKYGVTSNYVIGLDIVLADGRSLHVGGRVLDYPAYDLCGLITGSEGTLALLTAVHVRLLRNPPAVKTMMAVFDSLEQAGSAVSAVIAAGLVPATMEMMDRNILRIVEAYVHAGLPTDAEAVLIIDVDGYPASLEAQVDEVAHHLRAHGGHDLRIAANAEERDKIWYARKSAAGALSRLAPSYYLVDITVPRSRLAETLAEVNAICDHYGLRAGHVFHAGDGNLHPLILIMDPHDQVLVERVHHAGREIVELGVRKDGTITGEHGVGIEKRQYMPLMFSEAELSTMWDVKQVFDPRNLLNPGKIFPPSVATIPPQDLKGSLSDVHIPGDLFTPTTHEEAARALMALSAASRPVHIIGAPPAGTQAREGGDVLLCTSVLSGIKTFSPHDLYITVGAGTPLSAIQAFLGPEAMQVPLATPWPQATIGGLVAANVNAPLRMRYGSLRDLVICATVVLADGRVIRAGRPVIKNVAGYDLVKVFVGSHGTLGLITDVTLKLTPLPRARRSLLVPLDDLRQALSLAERVLPLSLVASALLLCKDCDIPATVTMPRSPYVLVYSAEGLSEDVQAELTAVRQALLAGGSAQPIEVESLSGTALWTEALHKSQGALLVRIGVPVRDLASYIQAQAGELASGPFIADIASGQLYAITTPDNLDAARNWLEKLRRPALESGGYAVVTDMPETWIGTLDRWGYRPETLDLMQALKSRWDPASILNPGAFIL